MSELRDKVYDFFKHRGIGAWNSEYHDALIENLMEIIEQWHIRERKKWGLGLLKGKPHKFTAQSVIEIRKKIEEG